MVVGPADSGQPVSGPDLSIVRRFVCSTVGGITLTVLSILAWAYGGRGPLPGTFLNSVLVVCGLPYWLVTRWLPRNEWSGLAAFMASTLVWALIFYAAAVVIGRLRGPAHHRGKD